MTNRLLVAVIMIFCLLSPSFAQEKKEKLIFTGDTNLRYSSYFFILPPEWSPITNEQVMALAAKIGYFTAARKDNNLTIRIAPRKKEINETFAGYLASLKNTRDKPGCHIQRYLSFAALSPYAYEAYLFKGCLNSGELELNIYLDLPDYIVIFGLTVRGNEEESVAPYVKDLERVVSTFRWSLGLSHSEVNQKLREIRVGRGKIFNFEK